MKIRYDKSLKLLGIGVSPFSRLGPQRWFDDYKIASYYGWDIQSEAAPPVDSLLSSGVRLPRLNSQSMLNDQLFQKKLIDHYSDRLMLSYKPLALRLPESLQTKVRLLAANWSGKNYENKALFRHEFGSQLPFPKFKILKLSQISQPHDLGLPLPVVLQHESLSGGKGTFMVKNELDLSAALVSLRAKAVDATVVVSELIESAAERSIQACVTKQGIFSGPLQRQIISPPQLMNMANAGREKFSGAQISPEPSWENIHLQMQKIAQTVGQKLVAIGYKGIFGLDFLVDKSGQLYLLEINQRMTGVTPLLNMLYRDSRDIPFLLLHILELAGADYKIEDSVTDPVSPQGSMLILHGLSEKDSQLVETPASGSYNHQTKLNFIGSHVSFEETTGNLLLQRFVPVGERLKAGSRLLVAFSKNLVLDESDSLAPSQALIDKLYSKISLRSLD